MTKEEELLDEKMGYRSCFEGSSNKARFLSLLGVLGKRTGSFFSYSFFLLSLMFFSDSCNCFDTKCYDGIRYETDSRE